MVGTQGEHHVAALLRIGCSCRGRIRLVFDFGGSKTIAFFGTYTEVVPASRLVWTNEEDPAGGPVNTLTFEERGDETRLVLTERYPSKEALDAAIAEGIQYGVPEFINWTSISPPAPQSGGRVGVGVQCRSLTAARARRGYLR